MGRYNGEEGSGSSNGQAIINTIFTAGEAIQRGDLVLQGADGYAYAAAIPGDTAIALQLRPTAGGPAIQNGAIGSVQVSPSSYSGAGYDAYDVVKLTNGNILVAFADSSFVPSFAVLNQDGGAILSARAIVGATGDPGAQNVSAVALANGGFAIGFRTTTGIWLAVFDSTGNRLQAPALVDNSPNATAVRVALLSNGNIVVVSQQGTAVKFAIYKTNGTQVKASTAVNNPPYSTSGDRSIGVVALTGGGFAVAYIEATDANLCGGYVQRFDSAGEAQGARATLRVGSGGALGFVYIVALTGGGYAAAHVGNGTGCSLGIFSATGVLQGAGVINLGRLNVEIYGNFCSLAASPNNQVGICYVAQTGALLMCAVYGADASVQSPPHSLDAGAFESASLTWNDDGKAYAVGNSSAHVAKVFLLSAGLYVSATWNSSHGTASTFARNVVIGVTSSKTELQSYMLVAQDTPSSLVAFVNFASRQAMTLMGVATAAAAKGAPVSTQLTGIANVRRTFGQSWATNQQSANPPGQRVNVVGNIALLQGVYATTPNPIN